MRRHQDDQFLFLKLVGLRAEERPEERDFAEDRHRGNVEDCTVVWIRPPMANVWPDSRTIEVCTSARRSRARTELCRNAEAWSTARIAWRDFQVDLAVAVDDRQEVKFGADVL